MGAVEGTVLGLDIGSARIGVASASLIARIPHPIGAFTHDDTIFEQLRAVCKREDVTHLVMGLPRGMQGQETQQTENVRVFGTKVAQELALPYSWQDEAVTSVQAEAELRSRGKPYEKGDIDALAAVYILEDYLHAKV